jgi:hypothetical protein
MDSVNIQPPNKKYLLGSTKNVKNERSFAFAVEFIAIEITPYMEQYIKDKSQGRKKECRVEMRKKKKKKGTPPLVEETPVDMDKEPAGSSSESNISKVSGSDDELNVSLEQMLSESSLKTGGKQVMDTSMLFDTANDFQDASEKDDLPITLVKKKRPRQLEEVCEPKPTDGEAPFMTLEDIKRAAKNATELVYKSFTITGSMAEEITSPFMVFIIEVSKKPASENYELCGIYDSDAPLKITAGNLKEKAYMSGYWGKHTPHIRKRAKEFAFDANSTDVLCDDKVGAQKKLDLLKKESNATVQAVSKCFSEYTEHIGNSKQSEVITQQMLPLFKDRKMQYILRNVFMPRRFFRTLSIIGSENAHTVGIDELDFINMIQKEHPKDKVTYTAIIDAIERMAWKIKLEKCFVERIIKKNSEYITASKEKIQSDTEMFIKVSEIYHDLLEKNRKFGHTCSKETVLSKWPEEVSRYFMEHSKRLENAKVMADIYNGNMHHITIKRVANLEMKIALDLCNFEKCEVYSAVCDDDGANGPYFMHMRDITGSSYNRAIVVSCCERRRHLIPIMLGKEHEPIIINELDRIEFKKGYDTLVMDRAHKITLDDLSAIIDLAKRIGIKKFFLFGNPDLYPKREGQPFKDICDSGKFEVHRIKELYNYKKVVGNFSSIAAISNCIKQKGLSDIKYLQITAVAINEKEKENLKQLMKVQLPEITEFKAMSKMDISNRDDSFHKMVIFMITDKVNREHISHLFDVTSMDRGEPTILFYNHDGIHFDKVKPAIGRCTSFSRVLVVHGFSI